MTSSALVDKKSDQELAADAEKLFKSTRKLQLVAALVSYLREHTFSWFMAKDLRTAFPAIMRMKWYETRADLRQDVVNAITGMKPGKALYKMTCEQQAANIDAYVDDGDVGPETFDHAYKPEDLVVLGKPELYWFLFRDRLPPENNDDAHKALFVFLVEQALAKVDALAPIITEVEVLNGFPSELLEKKLPFDKRVESRTKRRSAQSAKPPQTYTAADEYADVGGVKTLVQCIDLCDFNELLNTIERSMGFERPSATETETKDAEAPPVSVKVQQDTPTVAPVPNPNDGPTKDPVTAPAPKPAGPIATALKQKPPPSAASSPKLPAVKPGDKDDDKLEEIFADLQAGGQDKGPKGQTGR